MIAVAANTVLWPSWEPDRVVADLRAAIAAHAAYAVTVLGQAEAGRRADRARREAGLASNNLEASLARVMQEPRRGQRDRLQAVLTADATLRRIAGRLTALSLDPLPSPRPVAVADTAAWVQSGLAALGQGAPVPVAPGAASGVDMLDRLGRQVQMLDEIVARLEPVPIREDNNAE